MAVRSQTKLQNIKHMYMTLIGQMRYLCIYLFPFITIPMKLSRHLCFFRNTLKTNAISEKVNNIAADSWTLLELL